MPAHVVWLKRDLRLHDHRPLAAALAAAERDRLPVVVLYIDEPELLASPEWDPRHSAFIEDCLADVDEGLHARGSRLTRLHAEATQALDQLARRLSDAGRLAGLWSHEETGLAVTYARDLRVADWAKRTRTPWTEIPQHGVVRALKSRDGWARRWNQRMREAPVPAPTRIPCITRTHPDWNFGQRPEPKRPHHFQQGGEQAAHDTLDTFLNTRGVNYRADMASPVTGFDGCSRLSPHLAWGSLSIRTVHHALRDRQAELRTIPAAERDPRWLKSLTSFQGRLRWHCHFIQKLESEPAIEHRNMHRAYDHLRDEDEANWNDQHRARFEAWKQGRTGYPFVDACMRCLAHTGWMNFRMRSMLVSFASYHLWLHWRPTARHLAQLFTDFEPGIHYSQMQMQSGVTGINTVRIYNPIKQGKDQDPTGVFIRRWVPELDAIPDAHLHEPWKHTRPDPDGLFQPSDPAEHTYPPPVVDHAAAYKHAQQRIFEVRKTPAARIEAQRVYVRHGSRKTPSQPRYRGAPEDRGTA
ncbi:MAG: deoxyribodipyrimidine photo-lyase/cryptochrome family protein [Planctomycetota bacterium]